MRSVPRLVLATLLASGVAQADERSPTEQRAAHERLAHECRAFVKDYEASHSPKLLASVGLCSMRLERDGDAIDAYEKFLDTDSDLTLAEHDRVVHDVQALEGSIAYLTLQADEPGVMVSDARVPEEGERVTNEYGPIDGKLYLRVRPGHHMLTATLPGYDDARWEVDVSAASHDGTMFRMLRIDRPVPPPKHVHRGAEYGPWVLAGVGGAMLVAGTVTGIVALNKHDDIDDHCPNGICPSSYDLKDVRTSGKTFAAVTDVLLIGGALAAAGGVSWLLLEHASARVTATSGSIGFRGEF